MNQCAYVETVLTVELQTYKPCTSQLVRWYARIDNHRCGHFCDRHNPTSVYTDWLDPDLWIGPFETQEEALVAQIMQT